MADAHAKPAVAAPSSGHPSGVGVFILKTIFVIAVLFMALVFVVNNNQNAIAFLTFLRIIQIVAVILILVFSFYIFSLMKKFKHINGEIGSLYEKKYKPETKEVKTEAGEMSKRLNVISQHIQSMNPAEWRLGIIELDTLMREVLLVNGFAGETVADQLKSAADKPFGSLENAWEAHKVRNRIAHEGQKFELTEREAQRVHKLFLTVFEEFKVI